MPAPKPSSHPAARAERAGPWFSSVLLLAVLVIVGLRPLIQETHDTELPPFSNFLDDLPPIGPLPTLFINLIITVVFGLTMALRLAGRLPRPRYTGLWPGLIVTAAAACASCWFASNKRLALNATFDWLTLPLLAIALTCLLQRAWHIRLCLAVIIASGVASAINSYDQKLSFQDTVRYYQQKKAEMGKAADDPDAWQVKLFEKRLNERAATGFFAMTNMAGSYFLLTVFAAAALIATHRPRSWQFTTMALLAAIMGGALLLTRSRGAIAGLMIGLVFLGIVRALRKHIAAHRRAAWLAGWLLIVVGLAGIAAYGLKHGELPGGSLTYRWWYLETTVRMVRQDPWVGFGSEQYGRYYPRYKEIKSPEEISNPHNFLAQAAAEWGLPGMFGMIMMLLGGSWAATGLSASRTAPAAPKPDNSENAGASGKLGPVFWGIVLATAIWGLRIWIVGSSNLDYILASNAYPFFGWVIAFVVVMACTGGDTRSAGVIAPAPQPGAAALGAGLLAFLIYELINHALFNSGSGTTFFAVLAVCFALRGNGVVGTPRHIHPRLVMSTAVVLMTGAAALVAYCFLLSPVAASWKYLTLARRCVAEVQLSPLAQVAACHARYEGARLADLLDPTAPKELCQLILRNERMEGDVNNQGDWDFWLEQASLAADEVLVTDPESIGSHRLKAAALVALALRRGPVNLLIRASLHYDEALRRYPTNPEDWLHKSEIELLLLDASRRPRFILRSLQAIERALELDTLRAPDEVRRYSREKRATLEARLEDLRAQWDEHLRRRSR